MAIRDRFRRALRKSVSTGPTIRHTDTSLTTDSNTSNESEQSHFSLSPRRQSFLSRAFTWGTRRSSRTAFGDSTSGDNSDNNDEQPPQEMGLAQQINLTLTRTASEAEREMKAEKKRQRKAKYKNAGAGGIHPRDKPLTAQNLRHQAMLGTWTWDEAAGNSRHSFVSGISPCCTRPPSIHDGDDVDAGRGGDDYFDNGGSGSGHGVTSAPAALGGREY